MTLMGALRETSFAPLARVIDLMSALRETSFAPLARVI